MNDNKKALKCYQKAYEMCDNLGICGVELVDSLLKDNNEVLIDNLIHG